MTLLLEDLPYMPLTPEETMVVIIDPLECFISPLSETDQQALKHKMDVLCRVAHKIGVPVVVSVLGEGKDTLWPDWLEGNSTIDLYARTVANPWDDKGLRDAIDKHRPPYLVLVGFWGEISLTMTAISALRGGHEVFLLSDCCPDLESAAVSMCLDYMIRASIAPVSWRQLIFEWARHQPLILDKELLADLLEDTAVPKHLQSALCWPA